MHFLQIWIVPDKTSLPPSYDQKSFGDGLQPGKFVPVASKTGHDGSLKINQDVDLLIGKIINDGDKATYELKPKRHAWVQVATGRINLDGHELKTGDGAAISDETKIDISGKEPSQVLLFDLN